MWKGRKDNEEVRGHGKEREMGRNKEGNTSNSHDCDKTADPSQKGGLGE
jgi:hypothetical protein